MDLPKAVIWTCWRSILKEKPNCCRDLQKSWQTRLQSQGVVLLGIDGQEKASDAQAFLHKYGINYPNVQDTLDGSTGISYGVAGFPETVFIDRNGVVVAKSIAVLDEKVLDQELKKLDLN